MQSLLVFLKRYRYLLLVGWILLTVGPALAQTLTTDAPAPTKIWELVLKMVFPIFWTAGAPWLTALVTRGIQHVPPQVQVAISAVIGALAAGAAGAIPDFPLTMESAAEMGASQSAAGQLLANMRPERLNFASIASAKVP